MLDIIFGSSGQNPLETALRKSIQKLNPTGTLYFSYPIFENVEGQSSADALLVSDEFGLVAFDLSASSHQGHELKDWIEELNSRQDEIFRNIQRKLLSNKDLVEKRNLVIVPEIITVLHEVPNTNFEIDLKIATPRSLGEILPKLTNLPEKYKKALNASIEHVTTINPRLKRENVRTTSSYGHAIRGIEKQIANLDPWQKRAAISYPEGPQRIRGLAGSGKTIVLALKAAYLHTKHPTWNIVVTYYSRGLYQQFRDLIRRFVYDTTNDEPDWTKIQVVHSWGNAYEHGIYSDIARRCGVQPVSRREANNKYGSRAFDGICGDVLDRINQSDLSDPMYDAVLIDESQDLPVSFFRLIYAATRKPKRIVWAYDELQNFSAYNMASPDELFGMNKNGQPKVKLVNRPNRPEQDTVLPTCYRNTPWALTVAHGLGFGVYRKANKNNDTSIVQMFDDPNLWKQIGYEVIQGNLELGTPVSLRRHSDNTPDYYSNSNGSLIHADDAIQFKTFQCSAEQAEWIAAGIKNGLEQQELTHEDFLIILPDAQTARSEYGLISETLREYNIASHLVGVVSSREEVFQSDSIAVTHIYRAKGNEAPMVYFANAHMCYDGLQLAKKRNILFTGITRSRAWVRLSGIGSESAELNEEFKRIVDSNYELHFVYPTEDQLRNMRLLHRNPSKDEREQIANRISEFYETIKLIKSGELPISEMPLELQEDVRRIRRAQ